MRIIGGHDYYDSALAWGQDSNTIFIREDRIIKSTDSPLFAVYPHSIVKNGYRYDCVGISNLGYVELRSVSVYIADKHYGGVSVNKDNQIYETFWDYDRFEAWVNARELSIHTPKRERYKWEKNTEIKDAFPNLQSWFSSVPATNAQRDWLITNGIAVAVCSEQYSWGNEKGYWHCNGSNLKDIGFAKAVDPYTLFQELSMWVGGVLPRPSAEIVETTDPKIKAHKHGFDKWSFRKPPEAK